MSGDFSLEKNYPYVTVGGVTLVTKNVTGYKVKNDICGRRIYEIEFNNGVTVAYPEQQQQGASIFVQKYDDSHGYTTVNNIDGAYVYDNPNSDDIYSLVDCQNTQVKTFTQEYDQNSGDFKLLDKDNDQIDINGKAVKPFGLQCDSKGMPIKPEPDANGNIIW